jgi:hypothetical protein
MASRILASSLLSATISVVICSSVSVQAQQVASVDLTQITARTELRRPPRAPEVPEGQSGAHQTIGCEAYGRAVGALRTTLLALDRTPYLTGDKPIFEVKIENVGSGPVSIPFSPHLADLQPEDPGKKFAYSELDVTLLMGGRHWERTPVAGVKLYGAEERPDTMLTLQPGEWARIVAQSNLGLFNGDEIVSQHKDDPVDHANARSSVARTETMLAPTTTASVSHMMCLANRKGPDIPVTVTAAPH